MDLLSRALIPIVVLLVFALARKYMPAASLRAPEHNYSREELDARFSGTQWVVAVSMVVVGFIFTIGTHAALLGLNRYLATSGSSTEFVLWPQSAIWWFFPGFGRWHYPGILRLNFGRCLATVRTLKVPMRALLRIGKPQ
jgi:hypothetical protein